MESVLVSECQRAAGRLASCSASGSVAGARELTGGGQPAAPACTPRPSEDVLCLCGAPDVRTLLWVFLHGTWVSFATGTTLGWELEGGCQCGPDDLGQSEAPAEAAASSCSEPRSLLGCVGCGGTGAWGVPHPYWATQQRQVYHLLSREPWGDVDGPLSPPRPK